MGADRNLPDSVPDCARVVKKIFRRNFPKLLLTGRGVVTKTIPIRYLDISHKIDRISHKIDRISHKMDRICPIYFCNKSILPNCEANIARLALFAQQTGGGGAAAPSPSPDTPMVDVSAVQVKLLVRYIFYN